MVNKKRRKLFYFLPILKIRCVFMEVVVLNDDFRQDSDT